jgi:Uma2 family endonuclease
MATAKNLSYYPPLLSVTFPRKYTIEEYLEIGLQSEEKLDYVNGYIVQSKIDINYTHSTISSNILISLHQALKEKPYKALGSDLLIKTKNSFRFPDALVVSKNPEFYNNKKTTLLNPIVLVEVVSPESSMRDYVEKRLEYFDIESLQHYIIIEQDAPLVFVYTKNTDDSLLLRAYDLKKQIIPLPALNLSINIADIYDGVDFI